MDNLKKVFLSFMFFMMVCGVSNAQKSIASGTISDGSGAGVIGATVMEKSSANGTVTDLDGHFKLEVNKGATLVISYIGFKTIELPASEDMKITLSENANNLNEVIVTGYTTQRKADLTGAVSVVSVEDLAKQNENNPMKALQGRVPGMNISADGNPSGSALVHSTTMTHSIL